MPRMHCLVLNLITQRIKNLLLEGTIDCCMWMLHVKLFCVNGAARNVNTVREGDLFCEQFERWFAHMVPSGTALGDHGVTA